MNKVRRFRDISGRFERLRKGLKWFHNEGVKYSSGRVESTSLLEEPPEFFLKPETNH